MSKDNNFKEALLEEEDESLETIDNSEEAPNIGKILASWEIPEFHKQDKIKMWYIYFFAIIILLLIYSYFSKNPLFALIIVLFSILYIFSERNEPKTFTFAIAEDGLVIENKFIPYKKLKRFYIIYQPPYAKNLYFEPNNLIMPLINIPLEKENPVAVRKILLQYLSEDLEKEEIPNSESISHLLKL